MPRHTTISIQDAVRGKVEWDSNTIDDTVLIKTDGMPTYHFASMVDDHLMEITHIIRGEEWLSSAPKHAALFDSFGWERPIFVHCPLIVGLDGKKLSKRHGATRVLDYAAEGFLPGPLKNFIALIGWSPGDDREEMTQDELIAAFDIKGMQPSPGKFDLDKLKWLNGLAIRALTPSDLLDTVVDYLQTPYTLTITSTKSEQEEGKPDPKTIEQALINLDLAIQHDRGYVEKVLALEQQRVHTLSDFSVRHVPSSLPMSPRWIQRQSISGLASPTCETCLAPSSPSAAPISPRTRAWKYMRKP